MPGINRVSRLQPWFLASRDLLSGPRAGSGPVLLVSHSEPRGEVEALPTGVGGGWLQGG